MSMTKSGLFVRSAVIVLMVTAGACTPPSGGGTTTTTTTTLPPGAGVCAQLQQATAGSTFTLDPGTYVLDGDPATAGEQRCVVSGAARSGVTVRAASTGTVTLLGALQCRGCDGWAFDKVGVAGIGADGGEGVVQMIGGTGWSWTDCSVTQFVGDYVDSSGATRTIPTRSGSYGLFNVGVAWTTPSVEFAPSGFPKDWRVGDCTITGNGLYAGHDANQDHAVYAATSNPWGYSTNGVVEDSRVGDTAGGSPIKIGFGNSNGSNGGTVGMTVRRTVVSGGHSSDGVCGILVAGKSSHTLLQDNDITCPGDAIGTRQGIWFGSWPEDGIDAVVDSNRVHGASNPGGNTVCGVPSTPPPTPDFAIAGQQHTLLFGDHWLYLPLTGCSTLGITLTNNTSD
ncbi:MAG: hypothetical protein R2698_07665 [Microthrixaceae bacterium]